MGLLLLAASFLPPLFGQTPAPSDIDRIRARGELLVGMTAYDSPPFQFTNRQGRFDGLDIYYAEAIAKEIGVRARYVRGAKNWDDLTAWVERGEVDLALSKYSRTLDRSARVLFTQPYIRLRLGMLVNRLQLAQTVKGRNPEDFLRRIDGRIGVIKGASGATYARQFYPAAEIVEITGWDNVVDAAMQGQVLAAFRDELEVKRIIRGRPEAMLKLQTVILKDTLDEKAIAVPPGRVQWRDWLDIFLDQRKLNLSAESLLERYPEIFAAAKQPGATP